MLRYTGTARWVLIATFVLALLVGGWQRAVAVQRLPPDFDELSYIPAAFEYRRLAAAGDWAGITNYEYNNEHPPLVKLMFAARLAATDVPTPDFEKIRIGRPTPEDAQQAFFATRWLSWLFGMGQLAAVGVVHPVGALGLAVSSYHAKYTSQAYLESLPGLLAILAVLLFERALRRATDDALDRPLRRGLFLTSAVMLGLATASKYPYGLVITLAVAPFLVLWARPYFRWWFVYAAVALAAFFVAQPYLWPAPIDRFLQSSGFHFAYSQSEHVKTSALPWFQPLYWFTHAEPTKWHQGIFLTPLADWALLPLAFVGLGRALRLHPVFAAWLVLGLLFLLVWPTRWPQYILLILPAVSVCAGLGVEQVVVGVARAFRWRSAASEG